MLIFNLQLVKPISKIKSFRELAIREGFEDLRHGTGIVVVGIDARQITFAQILSYRPDNILVPGFMSARLRSAVAMAMSMLMLT